MRLRVVSWNIHKGIGGVDRRYRIDRVVGVLGELEPDMALLQEVSHGLPRSQFHDQAELLAETLGMRHLAFGPQHRFREGGYGNAILSRWPLAGIDHIDLTIGTRKRRGAICARTRVRFGDQSRTVVVINLHLGLAGSERGLQLERFLASHPFERLHHRTPIVLGGDLNDLWGSLGPRFLQPAGFSRAGPPAMTFPAAFPIRPLDGIFVRGDLRWHTCAPVRHPLARVASDHLPIAADLDLHLTPAAERPPASKHSVRPG